ncbi:hypothetical protein GWI33_007201 [Rhynchophorus ferrugineus]|uniref:Uncharacterized protein n=1 Tax=Rhynchophorus ferrugineus TaxID=354439 RepID=A0A834IK80_RHYFE|nr:hypothetical protein GWI33_007201 [Rhynchophorus ferrugineus]
MNMTREPLSFEIRLGRENGALSNGKCERERADTSGEFRGKFRGRQCAFLWGGFAGYRRNFVYLALRSGTFKPRSLRRFTPSIV